MFRLVILSGVLALSFDSALARHGGHDSCEHGCGYGYSHHGGENLHQRGGVWHRSRHHRETGGYYRHGTPAPFHSGQ
jgi:hypothetical protein